MSFFYSGYLPPRLPTTCLSMPPRFDRDMPNNLHSGGSHQVNQLMSNVQSSNGIICATNGSNGNSNNNNPLLNGLNSNNVGSNGGIGSNNGVNSLRKPLLEINDGKSAQATGGNQIDSAALSGLLSGRNIDSRAASVASNVMQVGQQQQMQQQQASSGGLQRNRMADVVETQGDRHDDAPEDYYISDLYNQLTQVIAAKPTEIDPLRIDDAEDPACVPMLWISKWVDYSDKYGLGYQLCDESVGVLFNDSTRLILCSSGENLQYIERDGNEFLYTLQAYPDWLQKKNYIT